VTPVDTYTNGNGAQVPALTRGQLFEEMGNRNLYSPFGFDWLEFLPQLRGRKAAEIYREMAVNDPIVSAILFEITSILRRVEWDVEPGASGPEGEVVDADVETADFLKSCMDDLSHSWEEFIADALTMLPYGFATLEIVYKRRQSADLAAPADARTHFPDGKVGWRKFCWLPPQTVTDFVTDEYGGIQAVVQGGMYGANRVTIPIDKLLHFRTDRHTPRGQSVLRGAVMPWYYRKRMCQLEGIGVERDLAGLPVFYLDADQMSNPTRKAEYQTIVRNLRRDEQEGVLLPATLSEDGKDLVPLAKLELLASSGPRQHNMGEVIGRYTREIAMSLLQDVMLLGHEKVGTQALAKEKRDLSEVVLQAWLNTVEGTINDHAVPRLLALNGLPLDFMPRFVPGDIRSTDIDALVEAVSKLASAGFELAGDPEVEQWMRRKLNAPLLPDGVQERLLDEQLNPPEPPPMLPPGAPPAEDGVPEPPVTKTIIKLLQQTDDGFVVTDGWPAGRG
jgi:hypothetical protein